MKIRSAFVSDVHLGASYARSDQFITFLKWLKEHKPDNLYIVGDFIDGWKLKRNWYWDQDCNLIIRKLFKMAKTTKVYYIAGNHDEFLRTFIEDFKILDFGNIHICDEHIHQCVNDKQYLIIHADKFDIALSKMMKYTKWLCYLGDQGYELLIKLNSFINRIRKAFRRPYWSLSQFVKLQVKSASMYVSGFEEILVNYTKERQCHGIIAGHIHCPDNKMLHDVHYLNCGDWVENCSAVIEHEDGTFELLNPNDWNDLCEKPMQEDY